jgi:hypothetical protein
MWWLPQTCGTHIRESRWFKSMYTIQGKTQPARHMLSTLSPCMAIDHTYLTWSTYSNLLRNREHIWINPLPWEEGLLTQFTARRLIDPQIRTQLLSHNTQWSSGKKSSFCWQLTTRLTGLIYQHAISTFNTCSRRSTHQCLTDACRGYNLEGAGFPHTIPWPSQPSISTFHLRAPPGLQFN